MGRWGLAVVAGLLWSNSALAGVFRVAEEDFRAGAGLISFTEVPLGTTSPIYLPSDYGAPSSAPTVRFGGFFVGQHLSGQAGLDCPGAAATACVVGMPLAELMLNPLSPAPFTARDSSQTRSPALSGFPKYMGPISIHFSIDLAGVGFDAGYFDAIGSMGISAYSRNGVLLGTVSNLGLGVEFLGLVSADGDTRIAGVQLTMLAPDPNGFTIDTLRFAGSSEIDLPVGARSAQVPEPPTLAMLLFALTMLRARRADPGRA